MRRLIVSFPRVYFNKLFESEGTIDYVIIENQISPIATRMKTIQGMIVQYFVMSNVKANHIDFISASNKLKDCGIKEKTKYSERKKLGISKCLEIISTDFRFNQHLNYFNLHKKKDDLSDSFLQGIWYINNKIKHERENQKRSLYSPRISSTKKKKVPASTTWTSSGTFTHCRLSKIYSCLWVSA